MPHDGAAMVTAATPAERSARHLGAGAAVAAARSLVFAVTSTGLALCAHHLASGQAVPGHVVLLAGGMLFLLALPLVLLAPHFARCAGTLPAVVVVTGAGQAALHRFFGAVQSGTTAVQPVTHQHDTGLGADHAWHAGHHHAVAMAAGHVIASLLVGWCLQRADSACRSVAHHLDHTLDRWFGHLVPGRPFPGRQPGTGPLRAWSWPSPYNRTVLTHTVVRRGPPATI